MSLNQNSKFSLRGATNIDVIKDAGGNQQVNVDDLNTDVDSKVERSGDTMTGELILSGNPSNVLGAVPKQYADLFTLMSILTTKGDLFSRNSSTIERLAIGSDGQILVPDTPSTGGMKWANLLFNGDEIVSNSDEIVTV